MFPCSLGPRFHQCLCSLVMPTQSLTYWNRESRLDNFTSLSNRRLAALKMFQALHRDRCIKAWCKIVSDNTESRSGGGNVNYYNGSKAVLRIDRHYEPDHLRDIAAKCGANVHDPCCGKFPVFVHWQYTKDRYVWLTQFGANGQDFFADVVQGQHGEDALGLAFFSLWYEWDAV